jgi:hypothetical protein
VLHVQLIVPDGVHPLLASTYRCWQTQPHRTQLVPETGVLPVMDFGRNRAMGRHPTEATVYRKRTRLRAVTVART